MKERELVRIEDEKVKQDMAKTIIMGHNELLRTDRMTNPDRFTFTKTNQFPGQDVSQYSKRRGFGMTQGGSESNMGAS